MRTYLKAERRAGTKSRPQEKPPLKKKKGIVVKQTMKKKEKGKETKSYLIKRESRQANEAL
jgi:hypothetical protein